MTGPFSGMWSSAACATSAGAMALVVMTSCHVSALTSSSGASGDTAVENTSASSPPMASTASATIPEQRSGSRTSAAMPVPLPAVVTTSFSLSSLRPTTVMSAPACGGGERGAAPDARRPADDEQPLAGEVDVDRHVQRTSMTSAEPMPPPAHMARRPMALPAAAQLVDHGDDHARAGGRDRVAQAAATAVHVDDRRVDAERADRRHRHRAERLVDLDQVDVVDGEAGALERLRDRDASGPCRCGRARPRRWPTTRSGASGRRPCDSA